MNAMFSGFRVLQPAILAAAALVAQTAVTAQTVDFSSTRGSGVSQSDVLIENVRVLTPVSNPFQPGTTTTIENNYNVTFRFDPASLHLVPVSLTQTNNQTQNCASATVSVYDAVRGSAAPIANASVTLGNQTLQTNAQGQVTFSGLPPSPFTVNATAGNYVAASQSITLTCAAGGNLMAIALSPSNPNSGGLGAGQFRVILTWGQNPSDLDSHLTGPAADGTTRWHVYYGQKTSGDMCGLDVDDVSSFGPETVTCPRTGTTGTSLRPGVYRYSVHHYSGTGNIGNSNASVRLEFAGGQQYRFTPPPVPSYRGPGDVWTVFELTVNSNGAVSMAPVDSVVNSIGSGSVRSGNGSTVELVAPQFGQAENMQLMQGLTK